MASVLHGLGNALYMQTEFARALDYYTKAVTILQRTKDKYGESSALQAIAMVHKELGDYAAAIDTWRKSLALAEAARRRGGNGQGLDGHRRTLPAPGRPRARAGTPDQGP